MRRGLALPAGACALAALLGSALAGDDGDIEAGRRIYMEGVLPSGAPLLAQREGGVTLAGAQAACVNCHRRSGMGSYEGGSIVPAVAGPILFSKLTSRRGMPASSAIARMDVRFRDRPAYDAQSFARALREGVSVSAYLFDYLMPRYPLGAPDLRALEAYLRSLTLQAAPGVEGDAIHLATVITPGADAAKKQAMLEVLNAFVAARVLPRTASGARRWRLHVWDLSGAEPEWSAQLAERYRDRPVMALLSGLGARSWAPVHEFCERRSLPCLFPNTDLPGAPEPGYASFYFNGGVGLEAQVVARHLLDSGSGDKVSRVLQLYREGDIGAAGARVLRETLAKEGIAAERRALPQDGRWADALAGFEPRDALVLWLRANDIESLTRAVASPPAAHAIIASGTLGGLEVMPLPVAWRKRALFTYPVEVPDRRALRMSSSLTPWLNQQHLPLDHEILRGNTLAASRLLEEAMTRLRGRYVRDYLIESVETPMGNPVATSAYPRFSLGAGQRYASKGSYLVRFADAQGRELALASDWIVP